MTNAPATHRPPRPPRLGRALRPDVEAQADAIIELIVRPHLLCAYAAKAHAETNNIAVLAHADAEGRPACLIAP